MLRPSRFIWFICNFLYIIGLIFLTLALSETFDDYNDYMTKHEFFDYVRSDFDVAEEKLDEEYETYSENKINYYKGTGDGSYYFAILCFFSAFLIDYIYMRRYTKIQEFKLKIHKTILKENSEFELKNLQNDLEIQLNSCRTLISSNDADIDDLQSDLLNILIKSSEDKQEDI